MKYRNFGKTSSKVSEIGMGCWAIGGNEHGNSYGSTDDTNSIMAIKRAVELGCNFFDTADVYGEGHSEELLGMALNKIRDKIMIATKVGGSYMYGGHWGMKNFSEEYIRFALEKSLQRLRTDYIDVYQLHNPPIDVIKKAEVFKVFAALKKEGKIRHIGISVHTLEEGVAALNYVDSIQCVFNMLYPNNYELIEAAKMKGVAVIAREPLCNGFLTDKMIEKMTDEEANEEIESVKEIHFEKGDIRSQMPPAYKQSLVAHAKEIKKMIQRKEPLSQLALKYVLAFKSVSVVIPGAKTPGQVEENIIASEISELKDKDMEVLGS